MDVPQTSTGKACKLCLKKGPGELCHLHCGTSRTPKKSARGTPKKSAVAKRRPRATPKSATTAKMTSSSTPSPRSGAGKKKTRIRTSPETPPSPPRSSMEIGTPPSPVRSLPGSMEHEWRLGRESPGVGSLGWSPSKAREYRERERIEHIKKYPSAAIEGKREIPFPPEFEVVYDKLKEICKSIPYGYCDLHPTTPAVQWSNNTHDLDNTKKQWQNEMHQKTNHYSQDYPYDLNKNYPLYDQDYCSHHAGFDASKQSGYAYKTLFLPIQGEDEEWEALHGCTRGHCDIEEGEAYRKISSELRKKIMEDSLEYLAQEYKIHLQPKPEYQFPVLRILAKLLATDKEFKSHVEAWKAVIPYHRVKTELNLPVIVIYPAWGKKSAEIVLGKIIQAFSKYDAAKIGLNHAPRFNKKYNELIYYAGGAGDQKKNLPDKYFTPGKIFYKGYELEV